MSLPVRLFDLNKDEDGYGYYYRDENGDKSTSQMVQREKTEYIRGFLMRNWPINYT